jgi:hypothetical protein
LLFCAIAALAVANKRIRDNTDFFING